MLIVAGRVWYPATGFRYSSTGVITYVGSDGYYWSGTPNNAALGYYLSFSASAAGTTGTMYGRGTGFAARCVSEF